MSDPLKAMEPGADVIRLYKNPRFTLRPSAPFGDEAQRWIDSREGLTPKTMVTYQARLERIVGFAPKLFAKACVNVLSSEVEALAERIGKARGLSHNTRRVHLVILLTVARELINLDLPLRAYLSDGRKEPRRRPKEKPIVAPVEPPKTAPAEHQLDLFPKETQR